MANDWINGLLEGLYEQFLLKDVTAKILPGSIIIASAVIGSLGYRTTQDIINRAVTNGNIGWFMWFLFAGLSWTVAFGIQWVGVKTKFFKHSKDKDFRTYQDRLAAFYRVASPIDRRFNLRDHAIKEATANVAISILMAIFFIVIGTVIRLVFSETNWSEISDLVVPFAIFSTIGVFIAFALRGFHLTSISDADDWVDAVIAGTKTKTSEQRTSSE